MTLRVQKAKKRDIGRNIIRIDPTTMEKLNIQTGDVIVVMGKTQSAGIAWPSYPQDNGLGIVRVDSRIQKNTGSRIDDTVEIRKIKTEVAQSVVLAPSNFPIKNNPRFEDGPPHAPDYVKEEDKEKRNKIESKGFSVIQLDFIDGSFMQEIN